MYKYQKVANGIIRDIKLEILRSGSKLPTDLEIMKKYGISRITARKAVQYLVEQGYVKQSNHLRIISDKSQNQESISHFGSIARAICIPKITNVITETEVQQANPYSLSFFHRNVGAYFQTNLWYQHSNSIILNTQSMIPAELVSQTHTDMYNKLDVQKLVEQKVYQLGHDAEITIEITDPRKEHFAHAIEGISNSTFFKVSEAIYDTKQQIILFNNHFISSKNAKIVTYTK